MKKLTATVLVSMTLAFGRIIVVPDSAPTVQSGLDMARFGDTVLVMPDVYEESVIWPSTDGIKLYSAAGPASTVISAGGSGRVISFGGTITRATELCGFTITGGKLTSAYGAGINTSGSPIIAGNVIRDNECHGARNHGGGIYCASSTAPLIIENEIKGNICSDSSTWNYGGGIYIGTSSTAEICRNLIEGNRCGLGSWNYGAGIYVALRGRPAIYGNVIRNNENERGSRGHGAGIYADLQSWPLIFSNVLVGNRNKSDSWNYGAGMKARGVIVNNTIVDNACVGGNWAYGGGAYLAVNDTAILKNNIIVENIAAAGGGIYRYDNTATVLINSYNDVWANVGGNHGNCAPGPGDISQDPQFVAGPQGFYCLSQIAAGQPSNSPCVDAGDTLMMTQPLNLDSLLRGWTTRTDSVVDTAEPDMGCHYPGGVVVGVSKIPPSLLSRVRVVPNPSAGWVRFELTAGGMCMTAIVISDAMGRVVHEAASRIGDSLSWDGLDAAGRKVPPGVYFYRLLAGRQVRSGRVVRVD